MKAMMRWARSSTEANSPLRSRRRSRMEKNSSTLVEPGRVGRGVVQEDVGPVFEERLNFGGEMRREVVDDAVQLHPVGGLGVEVGEELHEVVGAGRVGDPGGDVAFVHVETREQHSGAVAVLEL